MKADALPRRGFSTLHQARAAYERDYILKKLDENHGNVTRAAEVLGLERSHLYQEDEDAGDCGERVGLGNEYLVVST